MNFSRRHFLKTSASVCLAAGAAMPDFMTKPLLADSRKGSGRDTVLVVLQLSGGNDGLNTVVPFEDDIYHRSRPTLRLSGKQVLKISDTLGFHSDMPAFQRLFKEGQLSVVQGGGYPKNNRNHPQAMRDWQTGLPGDINGQTGWVGRAMDQAWDRGEGDLPGLFVGPIAMPFTLQSERALASTINAVQDWGVGQAQSAILNSQFEVASKQPLAEFVRATALETQAVGRRLKETASHSQAPAYPPFQLAETLRTIAHLIRAEAGIRIYCAELGGGNIGGFDTHAGQAANHGALLRQFSESVAAFVADLQRDKLLDRMVLMTFSEFGRTLTESGRRGTNHGAAAPVFLAGGKLKGGIIGPHPDLKHLDADAPRFHTDYRQLYATILDQWLGFDSKAILGRAFEPVKIFA